MSLFHVEVVVLRCASVPLSASELSLTEVRDKVPPLRRLDLGLMPLPDTACGLEWSSLVNAAQAFEGEGGDTSGLGVFNLSCRTWYVVYCFVRCLWVVCPPQSRSSGKSSERPLALQEEVVLTLVVKVQAIGHNSIMNMLIMTICQVMVF